MSESRIYTRTGDQGTTSLVDGSRVPKDALRVEAYGTIDEANSWLGVVVSQLTDETVVAPLVFLQHRFYNCSSNVAVPPRAGFEPVSVAAEDVGYLERAIDRLEQTSGPLGGFVLPGGHPAAGFLHVARTVCRRAERCLVALSAEEPVDPVVVKLVNRASDLLFAAARYVNASLGEGDIDWDQKLPIP